MPDKFAFRFDQNNYFDMPNQDRIEYSDKYEDDRFEYRNESQFA